MTDKSRKPATLNRKQLRFCKEYVVDLNATQAAIRAGYSKRTARQIGAGNLSKAAIKQKIAELSAVITEKSGINAEYVLKQAVKLHERCMSEVSPVMIGTGEDRVQARDEHGELVFKFDAAGAAKGLEIIGKHIEVQAFKEALEVSVKTDAAKEINEALARADKAAAVSRELIH